VAREANPSPLPVWLFGDLLGRRKLSVVRVTLDGVEVTEIDRARIPVGNLRVPRTEFVAVWAAAERQQEVQGASGVLDWYAGGVAVTCRWLAAAVVHADSGPRRLARSPVSQRTTIAYEELIEAEFLAAELLDVRRTDPAGYGRRPTSPIRWSTCTSTPATAMCSTTRPAGCATVIERAGRRRRPPTSAGSPRSVS
jgi:hypothetical protein